MSILPQKLSMLDKGIKGTHSVLLEKLNSHVIVRSVWQQLEILVEFFELAKLEEQD